MSVLNKIDEHLTENFTKGKNAEYLSGYMVTLFKNKMGALERAAKVGNYGIAHEVVASTMRDLEKIKKRLDQIAKGK